MPSTSPAQARLMNAVAHDPKFAKEVGIPQSVGQEFHQADKQVHPEMLMRALHARHQRNQGK